MSLARDVTTVGGGTLISRLLGFCPRRRHRGDARRRRPFSDAFFAALQVLNLFRRLLAEGALNCAFVPMWLRLRQGEDGVASADRLPGRAWWRCFASPASSPCWRSGSRIFVIVAVAPGFDEPRRERCAAFYLPIGAPYIVMAGLVAVISAALNAEGRVVAVTVCTIIFNLVLVAGRGAARSAELHPFMVGVWLAAAITAAGVRSARLSSRAWLWTGKRWPRARAPQRRRRAPLFRRAAPASDRRRHSAAQADGGRRCVASSVARRRCRGSTTPTGSTNCRSASSRSRSPR